MGEKHVGARLEQNLLAEGEPAGRTPRPGKGRGAERAAVGMEELNILMHLKAYRLQNALFATEQQLELNVVGLRSVFSLLQLHKCCAQSGLTARLAGL